MLEPLVQQIYDSVCTNPHLHRSGFQVEAGADRLTLRGNVETFYKKQIAQEAVKAAVQQASRESGQAASQLAQLRIDNRIEVAWNDCRVTDKR